MNSKFFVRKWERPEESVLIIGKSTFPSLFEVFVKQTESNMSILHYIRLIKIV